MLTSTTTDHHVIAPDEATLVDIVGDVFLGLLGEPAGAPRETHIDLGPLPVVAAVSLSGEWCGHVVFACSTEAAWAVTAEMLMMELDEVGDDDVRDVMGEFANIIGGNVKSVMPGPSLLSLPETSLTGGLAPAETVEHLRLQLAWRELPVQISVWTKSVHIPGETDFQTDFHTDFPTDFPTNFPTDFPTDSQETVS